MAATRSSLARLVERDESDDVAFLMRFLRRALGKS